MSDAGSVLELRSVAKSFRQGGVALDVLRWIDLEIGPGETVALLGQSGAGKSTLLHIAALLERPDAGRVGIRGVDCSGMNDRARTGTRRDELGMVYQFHHLMPDFTALENVMIPMLIAGRRRSAARRRAHDLLEGFGLGQRLGHRPARLSGGEQQRVAIARAVANEPVVLLADEPTGNLDQRTAEAVFESLVALARERAMATLVATHNPGMARRMDRVVELRDGVLRPA